MHLTIAFHPLLAFPLLRSAKSQLAAPTVVPLVLSVQGHPSSQRVWPSALEDELLCIKIAPAAFTNKGRMG